MAHEPINSTDFTLTNTKEKTFGVNFVGVGSSVPKQSISNDELSLRVETSDNWIKSRTGISKRRIIGKNESLSNLSAQAAHKAINMAGWDPESVDLIIMSTSTPDDLFGSAPRVQAQLQASNAVAFDLTAACSGFLFALVTASKFLFDGSMRRAIVLGADQLSRWVDWDDRKSCVLFGDGAGALAIEIGSDKTNGLINFSLQTDGSRGDCLNLPASNNYEPLVCENFHHQGGYSPIKMNGKEVYKFAVKEVPLILDKVLKASDCSPEDIDWLLLHQANQRILDAVADRFKIPYEKVLSNLSEYGNTSAATIPLMLDEAVRSGLIQPGHLIATSGFGAGLSWGSALIKWHGPI